MALHYYLIVLNKDYLVIFFKRENLGDSSFFKKLRFPRSSLGGIELTIVIITLSYCS